MDKLIPGLQLRTADHVINIWINGKVKKFRTQPKFQRLPIQFAIESIVLIRQSCIVAPVIRFWLHLTAHVVLASKLECLLSSMVKLEQYRRLRGMPPMGFTFDNLLHPYLFYLRYSWGHAFIRQCYISSCNPSAWKHRLKPSQS